MKCLIDLNFTEYIKFCEQYKIDKWELTDHTGEYKKYSKEMLESHPAIQYLYELRLKNNLKFSSIYEPVSWLNSYKVFYHIIKHLLNENLILSDARIISEYTIPNSNKRIDIMITYQTFIFIFEISYISEKSNIKIRMQKKSEQLENYKKLLDNELNLSDISIFDYALLINDNYIKYKTYKEDSQFILENINNYSYLAYNTIFNNENEINNDIIYKRWYKNKNVIISATYNNITINYHGIEYYNGYEVYIEKICDNQEILIKFRNENLKWINLLNLDCFN